MANGVKAKVMTVEEYEKLRKPVPKSWYKAAGLLRHKRKALEGHLKQVRAEWDRKR